MEKTGWCAKEEVSSSLLGKLALPCVYVTNIFLLVQWCRRRGGRGGRGGTAPPPPPPHFLDMFAP